MGKVSDHSDAGSPGSKTLGRIIGCLPRRKRPGGEEEQSVRKQRVAGGSKNNKVFGVKLDSNLSNVPT